MKLWRTDAQHHGGDGAFTRFVGDQAVARRHARGCVLWGGWLCDVYEVEIAGPLNEVQLHSLVHNIWPCLPTEAIVAMLNKPSMANIDLNTYFHLEDADA